MCTEKTVKDIPVGSRFTLNGRLYTLRRKIRGRSPVTIYAATEDGVDGLQAIDPRDRITPEKEKA